MSVLRYVCVDHWHIQNRKAETDSTVQAKLVWHERSKDVAAVIGIAAAQRKDCGELGS